MDLFNECPEKIALPEWRVVYVGEVIQDFLQPTTFKKIPDNKIVLLEGACCGYGASGRNGGFCPLKPPDAILRIS